MLGKVKNLLRPARDLVMIFFGFGYDLYRFLRHAGYINFNANPQKRSYRAVKIYHRLEKSLSFPNRSRGRGKSAADDLLTLIRHSKRSEVYSFHELVAAGVLERYRQASDYYPKPLFPNMLITEEAAVGGVKRKLASELSQGTLNDPESFFFSRWSIRDFSPKKVPLSDVRRAIQLAQKTPSVCNRQAWYTYYTDNRDTIDSWLELQNGNAGFGEKIPGLLVVTSDLNAFGPAGERYQHWIDGGMFAMSVIYALHALGIGSCCLNWSKTPPDDMRIRSRAPIKPSHSMIMMIAVGYPQEEINVCSSARPPIDSIFQYCG